MLLLDILSLALETGPRPDERLLNVLTEDTIVPASPQETWAFFSDALNLERITPGWLNFTVRTPPPIQMQEGTEIDYTIVLHVSRSRGRPASMCGSRVCVSSTVSSPGRGSASGERNNDRWRTHGRQSKTKSP